MSSHTNNRTRRKQSAVVTMGAIPIAAYLILFTAVTCPLMLSFSTHLFADARDGLVMVWGVWWTKTAVMQLQSPFSTTHIFYPAGVNLLSHTLTSLAGSRYGFRYYVSREARIHDLWQRVR